MHGGIFSVILDEVLSTVAYQHSGEFGPFCFCDLGGLGRVTDGRET